MFAQVAYIRLAVIYWPSQGKALSDFFSYLFNVVSVRLTVLSTLYVLSILYVRS